MSRTLAKQRQANDWMSSTEWYTPPWLLECIADFLGADYYDPCPARNGSPLLVDGLAQSWAGLRVFCNPPYGRAIVPWIHKAMTEPVEEIILLVPAYTETRWFEPLLDYAICFIRGRINYSSPMRNGGKPRNAPHASALVYRGPRPQAFAEHFADIGPTLSR